METGQFFLSALEVESLVSYLIKLLDNNKDTQDYTYTCEKPATKQDAFPKEVDAKDVFSMKAVIGILSTVGMIVIGIWTAKCLMRRKRKVKKYV